MDLEFVERCNVNLEFRIKNEELERKFRIQREPQDLFATNVAHKIWVSDWSPAEGVPGDNFVGDRNGAKAKGRK